MVKRKRMFEEINDSSFEISSTDVKNRLILKAKRRLVYQEFSGKSPFANFRGFNYHSNSGNGFNFMKPDSKKDDTVLFNSLKDEDKKGNNSSRTPNEERKNASCSETMQIMNENIIKRDQLDFLKDIRTDYNASFRDNKNNLINNFNFAHPAADSFDEGKLKAIKRRSTIEWSYSRMDFDEDKEDHGSFQILNDDELRGRKIVKVEKLFVSKEITEMFSAFHEYNQFTSNVISFNFSNVGVQESRALLGLASKAENNKENDCAMDVDETNIQLKDTDIKQATDHTIDYLRLPKNLNESAVQSKQLSSSNDFKSVCDYQNLLDFVNFVKTNNVKWHGSLQNDHGFESLMEKEDENPSGNNLKSDTTFHEHNQFTSNVISFNFPNADVQESHPTSMLGHASKTENNKENDCAMDIDETNVQLKDTDIKQATDHPNNYHSLPKNLNESTVKSKQLLSSNDLQERLDFVNFVKTNNVKWHASLQNDRGFGSLMEKEDVNPSGNNLKSDTIDTSKFSSSVPMTSTATSSVLSELTTNLKDEPFLQQEPIQFSTGSNSDEESSLKKDPTQLSLGHMNNNSTSQGTYSSNYLKPFPHYLSFLPPPLRFFFTRIFHSENN